ncbi:MAG: hypothetical protein JWN51_1071 [Phycisphaerales bacterium]|nr:hypothetical protein [Phycisphaerales bacterium]
MAREKPKRAKSPASQIGRSKPSPGFEAGPPPELTNRSHPAGPGEEIAVPGAGVLGSGADAGPIESGPPDLHDVPYPGQSDPHAPKNAPGALRPGTTVSGVPSVPAHGGINAPAPGGLATETGPTTESGLAPFDLPTGPDDAGVPEGASETLAPEIHDPNYSAAHREREKDGPVDPSVLDPDRQDDRGKS